MNMAKLEIKDTKKYNLHTILMLGARSMQIPAFQAAKGLGIQVIAVDPSSSAVGFSLADKFYVADLADFETITAIARKNAVDGVMTLAADYPVPAVAEVAEQLNLPGLKTVAARTSTNKAKMRKALERAGVSVPKWERVSTFEEAERAVRAMGTPSILKPVDSSGGRGVTYLDNLSTSEDIRQALTRALDFSRLSQVIVEEFISGKEVSVEAITQNGHTEVIAITDKLTTEKPFFVEIGHSQPSQLPPIEIERIKELTIAGIKALEIDNSPSHTEIRLGPEGPRIMEIGARLGGGFISSHLVPLSTGIDLIQAAILLAVGQSPNLQPSRERGAAIRFLRPKPGKVIAVRGIDQAEQVKGIKEVVVNLKVGDYVPKLMDATGRIGYVICEAAEANKAIEYAEQARDKIIIDQSV